MQLSNFALFGIIEAFVLLIAVCIFLLLYARNLKKATRKLQEKIRELTQKLKAAKKALIPEAPAPDNSYDQLINDQLLLTRQYHQTLDAAQDIALDLDPKVPFERQVLAFRHALLIAEKEAFHAGDGDTPNWNVLAGKLEQLMQFYQGNGDTEEAIEEEPTEAPLDQIVRLEKLQAQLESSQKRIVNLEKFKKLFFDMEKEWESAKAEAQGYYEQLSAMADGVADQENFEGLLARYNNVYGTIGEQISAGAQAGAPATGDTIIIDNAPPRVVTTEIVHHDEKTTSELRHLRTVAADQHRIISELQTKLNQASTEEEKTDIINTLKGELDQQSRFLQESETCIQLIEQELSQALARIAQLEPQADQAGDSLQQLNSALERVQELEPLVEQASADREQVQNMQGMLHEFTEENTQLLKDLASLQKENEELAAHASGEAVAPAPSADSGSAQSSAKVSQLEDEIIALQSQYAELEERYLDLKMR